MRFPVVLIPPLLFISACGGGGGGSSTDANESAALFAVAAVTPGNGATLATFPDAITIVFNRVPASNTANSSGFQVRTSGGDGAFSEGNESILSISTISVGDATVSLDFTGTNISDDSFQIRVISASDLTDSDGNTLDGDGDGSAGGDFISVFTVDSNQAVTPGFAQVQAIFTANCTFSGCHSGSSPQQDMNLTDGKAYLNIVAVTSNEVPGLQRIEPGNPDDSYLVQKIEGTASVGDRMPRGRAPLSSEDIQTIRDWVSAGALEN